MMKSRLHEESHAKGCFEIEELLRIFCDETERARHVGTDELYAQKKDEPSTVSQLLSHIQDLQDKVKPWMERKNSIIRKQRAALECPTFPVNPREF